MFVPPKKPERELWDGTRTGVARVVSDFGADVAYPNDSISDNLAKIIDGTSNIYYTPNDKSSFINQTLQPLCIFIFIFLFLFLFLFYYS